MTTSPAVTRFSFKQTKKETNKKSPGTPQTATDPSVSGRRWDKGGDFITEKKGWWSNQTVQNYNDARQCVANVYNNITQGPYYFANGETRSVSMPSVFSYYSYLHGS